MTPVGVCVATRTVPARLVVRDSHPGGPVHLPLLVARCPWTAPYTAGHSHAHPLTHPGARQLKAAPCNRRPYVLDLAGAA
jgi:hypothetical protein